MLQARPDGHSGDMTEDPPTGVRRVLLDSGNTFSAFVIALPASVLVVVVLAVGLGLSVVARGFAGLERVTVTLGTVETHTQRVFAKLGPLPDDAAHRRVQAVLHYLRYLRS
ncbi:MAG: hypothetical protein Q8O61_08450 [Nocardioides sp.]|nr:hypothetical protein [Nocardioides sp.]